MNKKHNRKQQKKARKAKRNDKQNQHSKTGGKRCKVCQQPYSSAWDEIFCNGICDSCIAATTKIRHVNDNMYQLCIKDYENYNYKANIGDMQIEGEILALEEKGAINPNGEVDNIWKCRAKSAATNGKWEYGTIWESELENCCVLTRKLT